MGSKQIMGERVKCKPKTHISKIGKLDFFHTESKCSEIKVTPAMGQSFLALDLNLSPATY